MIFLIESHFRRNSKKTLLPGKILRRNPPEVQVTSREKLCAKIIYNAS